MIDFRCWYCNRRYSVVEKRVGQRITCGCQYALRVPKRSGGRCRVKTLTDWVVETVVYAGGGAFLGVGMGLLICTQVVARFGQMSALYVPTISICGVLGLVGFLAGLFGGERGMNWLGRLIRAREEA